MAWRQPDIVPKLLAIVELPVENFADQCVPISGPMLLSLMRSWIFFALACVDDQALIWYASTAYLRIN